MIDKEGDEMNVGRWLASLVPLVKFITVRRVGLLLPEVCRLTRRSSSQVRSGQLHM